MVDDDLAELEAAQKAKAQRRRRNVLIALYVAGWYIVLMLTAVEFLLRDGSGPSILLGWLGVLPAWITMIGWTAAYVTDRIIEDE